MKTHDNLSPAEMFDQYFGPALFAPGARMLLDYADVKPGEHILDLATGTGTVARLAAPMVGEGGKVVALDINPNMLAVAHSRPAPDGAAIEWKQGDAASMPLPDGAFDLVLCQQGLQFFSDRAAGAREMRRILAVGGRLVLNLWQGLELQPVYKALAEAEARYLNLPISALSAPSSLPEAAQIYALLDEAGFQRIEITPVSFDVRFPQPERFVYLNLFAAAAFLPEFNWQDEASRSALIETVNREIEPVVSRYRDGDRDQMTFPAAWHFVTAYTDRD
jgi:ubiquinone/menaquinone biosynthesis C-methylase UbiE